MSEESTQANGLQDQAVEPTQQTEAAESNENQGQSHEPPKDSPRWNEIYGKMKQHERTIDSFRSHNEQLMQRLSSIEEKNSTVELESKRNEFKEAIQQASESGDYEKVADLNLKYSELVANKSQQQVQPTPSPKNTVEDQQAEREFQTFKAYNPWFGTDNAKTELAKQIDAELKNDPNWSNQPNSLFLAEIARRVTTQSNLTQTSEAFRSQPMSEGVSDAPAQGNNNQATLTDAQKNIALKMLWVKGKNTPEEAIQQYQKQLQLMG